MLLLILLLAAVVVGFNASSYTATEGEPAVLCVQTLVGTIETTITLLLTTFEVTGVNN
jgi:hypothetical protein